MGLYCTRCNNHTRPSSPSPRLAIACSNSRPTTRLLSPMMESMDPSSLVTAGYDPKHTTHKHAPVVVRVGHVCKVVCVRAGCSVFSVRCSFRFGSVPPHQRVHLGVLHHQPPGAVKALAFLHQKVDALVRNGREVHLAGIPAAYSQTVHKYILVPNQCFALITGSTEAGVCRHESSSIH